MRKQTSWAKVFASAQVTLPFFEGASGVATCRPLPPVVLQKLMRPNASSRSRISWAASTTVEKATSGPESRSNTRRPGTSGTTAMLTLTRCPEQRSSTEAQHDSCSGGYRGGHIHHPSAQRDVDGITPKKVGCSDA